ncbi:MAG TPA: phosphatidylserine decarboxylase [Opitutaceae bacterium]
MPAEPVRYYNRITRTVETEEIYGEGWLRFAYENPIGRFFTAALVRRAILSQYYGWQMTRPYSAHRVLPFIVKYNLDTDEFAKSPFDFKHFNDFFTRALKKSARPITPNNDLAVFPADGRHLCIQDINDVDGFYVKGQKFDLEELLGDFDLSQQYDGGTMIISRLCPVDYHRFHFPTAGIPDEPRLINGWLYSVNPIALRRNVRFLVENKRYVTQLPASPFGKIVQVEIGATMVGSVVHTFVPGRRVEKGEEKGLFKFGGSCVITLFRRGSIKLDSDLVEQSRQGLEVYARMGDRMGCVFG